MEYLFRTRAHQMCAPGCVRRVGQTDDAPTRSHLRFFRGPPTWIARPPLVFPRPVLLHIPPFTDSERQFPFFGSVDNKSNFLRQVLTEVVSSALKLEQASEYVLK
jgi:hypothetical protein